MPHIASTLGEVDSVLCAEDGGVKFGGMMACSPTSRIETPRRAVCPHTAVNNIKPRDFTSSVTPLQLLLEEKPIVAFAQGRRWRDAPDEGESCRSLI